MALDHAPVVFASGTCDPVPSWSPHRSRMISQKRAFSPREPAGQSAHRKRPNCSPTIDHQANTTSITPAPVFDCPTRRLSTEEWVEEIGRDVPMNIDSDLAESVPPFYLEHDILSNHGNLNGMSPDHVSYTGTSYRHHPPLPTHWPRDAYDSSEEYRSVIDDLTVENKLLRQKLDRYERSYSSHLQDEKLFEVKIHGLSARKRAELEKALRDFASSLDETPDDDHERRVQHSPQYCKPLHPDPTPADSAYASTSASEHTLNMRSRLQGAGRDTITSSMANRQQNVTSTHSVPRSLEPSNRSLVSDSERKRSVVRRLEQLFAGNCSATFQPGFSRQQQELTHSTTTGDKHADETNRFRRTLEGAREAKILPNERVYGLDSTVGQPSKVHGQDSSRLSTGPFYSDDNSSHQRPTRPTDLDISKAQDGANNINYMRHLGLDLPVPHPGLPEAGNGWVYLNLLISMAQLHTLNVTLDFVRKAVAEISSKFELSSDGQQVRWRGGTDESSPSLSSDESWVDELEAAKTTSSPQKSVTATNPGSANCLSGPDLRYKPIFAHSHATEGQSLSDASNREFYDEPVVAINRSVAAYGMDSIGTPGNGLGQNTESGPIIFYSNANFCTDLSGNPDAKVGSVALYPRCFQTPLGSPPNREPNAGLEEQVEKRGVLSRCARAESDHESNGSLDVHLEFPNIDALSLSSRASGPFPRSFEASGLSGIQPQDHFMIDIHTQNGPKITAPAANPLGGLKLRLSGDCSTQPGSCRTIISAVKTDLAPSLLPSPSYICLPFSPSESDTSDGDGELDDQVSDSFPPRIRQDGDDPLASIQGSSLADQSGERSLIKSPTECSKDSSNSSIDLLSFGRRFNDS